MNIPVIVVDDEEADRYLVKRQLKRAQGFKDLVEVPSGDQFLELYFTGQDQPEAEEFPLLVLMDINMPGRNGFQTIEEAEERITKGLGPSSVVILMITSSNNIGDRERADNLGIVKGFISKPIDGEAIEYIRGIYNDELEARREPAPRQRTGTNG